MYRQLTKDILYVIIVVLLLIASYFAYDYAKRKQEIVPQPEPQKYEWITYRDDAHGIEFKYPKQLLPKFIRPVAWPPRVSVTNGTFTCEEGGLENTPEGETKKVTVDSVTYCVRKQSEGAAGSIYTNYTYTIPYDKKILTVSFSLQAVQCANYNDPQKSECEKERATFSLDTLVNEIITTVSFYDVASSTPPSSQGKSGIYGKVMLGPTCPVMRNPPDPQCADKPYKTQLALTTKDGLRTIKKFNSDENGNFSVQADPGEYQIKSASTGVLPRCSISGSITVTPNAYTKTTVDCDTGIR